MMKIAVLKYIGPLMTPEATHTSSSRNVGQLLPCSVLTAVIWGLCNPVFAQRAHENAVTEATDAFGTVVGREEIGLYSSSSARGFNPSEAGNLRIGGLYFDQASKLGDRVVRSSTVHVGISSQGFPFPAPTGVVNFELRVPAENAVVSALVGYSSYGDQAYSEIDFQMPLLGDALSIGGGVGYSRNSSYNIAALTNEWTAGAIARWQPLPSLVIVPFWSMTEHREEGERTHVYIGNDGYPDYRGVDMMSQPWADYGTSAQNFGGTANYFLKNDWLLAAGLFRSESSSPLNYDPLLLDTNGEGEGDYFISAVPPRGTESTSGEIRLSNSWESSSVLSNVHFSLRGRDRSSESGGADVVGFGPGNTLVVPQVEEQEFNPGPVTLVEARQAILGVAYGGIWENVGQLSVGVQKVFYERTITRPGASPVSGDSTPWLYNFGGAVYLSRRLVAYASYTRGFEEIGTAPQIAVNNGEAVPAQLTEQVDAGIKLQILDRLQLVAGVFEIEKPYFDLDQDNVFRQLGNASNRGIELSLAGGLTENLTVVAGVILIDPEVTYDESGSDATTAVAVGPIPGLVRANFQYRMSSIPGFTVDAEIESQSRRYARYDTVRLPAVTVLNAGVRYDTQLLGRDVTFRLKGYNLTNEYGLNPSASGKVSPFDGRGFDFSVALDI
jgi:iron complex outermembrane recepter protein